MLFIGFFAVSRVFHVLVPSSEVRLHGAFRSSCRSQRWLVRSISIAPTGAVMRMAVTDTTGTMPPYPFYPHGLPPAVNPSSAGT